MPEKAEANSVKSINESNRPSLLAVVVANFAVFAIVARIANVDFASAVEKISLLLPVALGLVFVQLLLGLFTPKTKQRIVYWGPWNHPEPGCRAFSEFARNQDEFTPENLHDALDLTEFPQPANEQNALWYRLYEQQQGRIAIMQVNRSYLLMHDYAVIAFLFVFTLGPAAFWLIGASGSFVAYYYFLGLVIQYLLARLAAKNYGHEIVIGVLAKTVSTAAKLGAVHPEKGHHDARAA